MSADVRIIRPPATAKPEIVALYDYWRSKAPADGTLPGRKHIDPLDIPTLLPHIWLVDVVDAPRRFRVRLLGTALVDTGTPLKVGDFIVDRLLPEQHAASLAEFESVVQSREPFLAVLNEILLQAGGPTQATRSDVIDAAAATIKKNLTSR